MKNTHREFRLFTWKAARYRICSPAFHLITGEIKKQRELLETYIRQHPAFKSSLVPLSLLDSAPPLALTMADAARKTDVGPMAAVAGGIAEAGVKAACAAGVDEAIVENGGDIYLTAERKIHVGLYSGGGKLADTLAFCISPGEMPLAICSSSSRMGHSASFGACDLATVTSKEGALADAAATRICNDVKEVKDIEPVLEVMISVPGILGILIIKDDHIGMIGNLPRLVKNRDPDLHRKITRDSCWIL
jgi:uncharacterized protein